jgi:hypothetical protein
MTLRLKQSTILSETIARQGCEYVRNNFNMKSKCDELMNIIKKL